MYRALFALALLVGAAQAQNSTNTTATATALVSGTAVSASEDGALTQADVVAGGETVIITLDDGLWDAQVGDLGAQETLDLMAGFSTPDSTQAAGWTATVNAALNESDVVRTSATVVTITLPAVSGYSITAREAVYLSVPASATDQGSAIDAVMDGLGCDTDGCVAHSTGAWCKITSGGTVAAPIGHTTSPPDGSAATNWARCSALNVRVTDFATESPTATPTLSPTAVPTETPTLSPTAVPTAAPTDAPTAAPTDAPTAVPTAAPTATPTATPTPAPVDCATTKTEGECKGTCGSGLRTDTITIDVEPVGTGKACPEVLSIPDIVCQLEVVCEFTVSASMELSISLDEWSANEEASVMAFSEGVASALGVDPTQIINVVAKAAGGNRRRLMEGAGIEITYDIVVESEDALDAVVETYEGTSADDFTEAFKAAAKDEGVWTDSLDTLSSKPNAKLEAESKDGTVIDVQPEEEGGESDTTSSASQIAASISAVLAVAALAQ